jgi:beta-1,4-mannosyltransferase
MFGSGLPVCALSYSCINELVKDGHTGLLFSNAEQLSQHLQTLLHGFPSKPSKQLQHMQAIVAEQEQGLRWDQNWQQVAWPVLSGKQGNRRAR